jgi:hypothetical protein
MAMVIGRPSEEILAALTPLGVEVRVADGRAAHLLRKGSYGVETPSGWVILVVPEGETETAAEAADRDATGHLGNAAAIFDGWWDDAHPIQSTSAFDVGDFVRPVGQQRVGTVTKVVLHPHGYDVHVRLDGRQHTFDEDALELVQGDPNDPEFWIRDAPGTAQDLALTLSYT